MDTSAVGWPGFVLQGRTTRPRACPWLDVEQFAAALNASAGSELYRLPTEAEWEYACRAGTTTRWSFGDDEVRWTTLLGTLAILGTSDCDTASWCRRKNPIPWGLYDMHGICGSGCMTGTVPSTTAALPKGSFWSHNRIQRVLRAVISTTTEHAACARPTASAQVPHGRLWRRWERGC